MKAHAEVIAAALPLRERLSATHAHPAPSACPEATERLRTAWLDALGDVSGERLSVRLANSGETLASTLARLVAPLPQAAEPAWASLLDELAEHCKAALQFLSNAEVSYNAEPVPFEHLLQPWVQIARERLRRELGAGQSASLSPCLSERAYVALERGLLMQLANVAGLALYGEFEAGATSARRATLKLLGQVAGEAPRTHYLQFVRMHLEDGYAELYKRYPVLLRLLGTCVNLWVESSAEFLRRLALDWPELVCDPILNLRTGLSDPHNGHRYVVIIERSADWRLVYKPKDLAIESAFGSFLDWCNRQGADLDFKPLEVWPREGYGWTEYVAQKPCSDTAAAHRYYQRAGALLAVLDLLRATDCHRENLIAHGEYPLIIDLETLLRPAPRTSLTGAGLEKAAADLEDFLGTVIGTGLLPRWELDALGTTGFDVSGLACLDGLRTPRKAPRLAAINTDDMILAYEHVTEPQHANVPRYNDATLYPDEYGEDVCRGFADLYRLFLRERDQLHAADGPLAAFRNARGRLLLRNTRDYHYLLAYSYQPAFLCDGVERSLTFERLFANADGLDHEHAVTLIEAEIDALERMDVPYFATRSDSRDLWAGEEKIVVDYFGQSGLERVQVRLTSLSESDLLQQQYIIRGSLLSARRTPPPTLWAEVMPASVDQPTLATDIASEALRIGEEILARAVRHEDGRLSWRALSYLPPAQRYQMQPLGENLYEGKTGVAIFLASLSAVTGDERFADAARRAFQLVRTFWREPLLAARAAHPTALGIGGILGVGSVAYALLTVARLLNDGGLQEDGLGMLGLITEEAIRADEELDLMGGVSGALLCLLRGYAEAPCPKLLETAMVCGDHLLSRYRNGDGWPRRGSQSGLTGLSHGAAGIALALGRLARATGERRFQEGMESALQFERTWYSPEHRNWQDLRQLGPSPSEPGFMNSWCHGAAGIGLSRLELRGLLSNADLASDVSAAVDTVLAQNEHDLDHLCCGNFGRYELLRSAVNDDPELRRQLHSRVARAVQGAAERGGYRLHYPLPADTWHPGFFRGTSGIGYSLLRLAGHHELPNIMTLE